MPQDSAPLSANQIALMRRWIVEGADNDHALSPCYELTISNVPLSSAVALEIGARMSSPAFLTLTLRSATPSPDLDIEEGSVNAPRERANNAAPGEWIRWKLRKEQSWPTSASVILRIQYASGGVDGSVLTARLGNAPEQRSSNLSRFSCGPG